jgi:hypothetical protein|tara:strand:- start:2700 stop:3743 length:1044 start_codon:yes stop_codon:yes gene_type:complete
MRATEILFEYESLEQAKAEIIKTINALDPNEQNQELLDKVYTVLNSGNVTGRFSNVLPKTLQGEYNEIQTMKIAGKIAEAQISFQDKMKFADSLAQDNVINHKLLLTPGIHTLDALCNNDPINKAMFDHLKTFGVSDKMKGPCEHGLAILSGSITIQGKGDVDVNGVPVEIKAAASGKGVSGGRFGETGEVPPYDTILNHMHSFEWLKGPLDEQRAKSVNGAINLRTFVNLVNNIPNVNPADRQRLGNGLSQMFFNGNGGDFESAFNRPGADPNQVNRAWIKSQFNWYKNSDMGGRWEILAGIMFGYNTIGVVRQPADLDGMNLASDTIYLLYGKPMEALFQFNPRG